MDEFPEYDAIFKEKHEIVLDCIEESLSLYMNPQNDYEKGYKKGLEEARKLIIKYFEL